MKAPFLSQVRCALCFGLLAALASGKNDALRSPAPVDALGRPKIVKLGTIDCDLVETTPIVFQGRLYRCEWVRTGYAGNRLKQDHFRLVDHQTGRATPAFARGYLFASAFVESNTVHVTGTRKSPQGDRIQMFASRDLTNWESWVVFEQPGFGLFNTSLCRAADEYVLMSEIDRPAGQAGVPFTARFLKSKDLRRWDLTPPECNYAKDRYTAPHCLRYLDGWFYNFYLEACKGYELRVVRSRDLIHWQPSPLNPVLRASDEDRNIANPKLTAAERERVAKAVNLNNSDIDFCEFKGRLVINYSWGNQQGVEHLAEAVYEGTEAPFLRGWFPADAPDAGAAAGPARAWTHPLINQRKLNSPLVEVTPFVFKDRLYLLENWQKQWEFPGSPDGSHFQEDEIRIRDVAADKIVSVALNGHGLGMALVWSNRVHVFAGNWGTKKKWEITEIEATSSDDLVNWTKPIVVLRAEPQEKFFNVSVCRGREAFVLLAESNDPKWPPFTFKYFKSDDLMHWTPVPDAIYGRDKYVGGPALYFEGGWYYTLYLESLSGGKYETRITRSRDLLRWQDAPAGRPVVTFNPTNTVHPLRPAHVRESNASDAEVVFWRGKTRVYFTGGDQQLAGDLQLAEFNGTPRELFESFFKEDAGADTVAPDHAGDWYPVLVKDKVATNAATTTSTHSTAFKPSSRQLKYQEAQLGAFIHFGPASYLNSDMLAVPPASLFNPTELDADQWVRAAKSFGAKHVILTTKHHNGFCLWPTTTTDYSVKSSPWRNGQGDVVREFVAACRRHGLSPGVYLSAGDKHFPCWSTPDPLGKRKLHGDRAAYFHTYLQQVKELLTQYGELCALWIDGAYDPFGWDVMDSASGKVIGSEHARAIRAYIHALQPGTVIFSGFIPDVRWSGSEQGWAAYPLFNVVTKGNGPVNWISPEAEGWFIPEAVLHTRSTWFWSTNSDPTLKSLDGLVQVYYDSIGRGANLLVNMTPDPTGRIPEAEVKRLAEFGAEIQRRFSQPIAELGELDRWSAEHALELDLKGERAVDHLVIEEDLRYGQRIREYQVEAQTASGWKPVASGSTVGRRRIEMFAPVLTAKLRFRVTQAGAIPQMRLLAAYSIAGAPSPETSPAQ
ncbi:MAG: alpha-L-fucosidase [Chloroflexi bacterium]|nr:alpha-L-fucosidase [Chloroflexota bacterium]